LFVRQMDELETIDSVVDLLQFMRNDTRNLLVRNPEIQRVVQNSVHLFTARPQPGLGLGSSEQPPAGGVRSQNRNQAYDINRYSNVPVSESDLRMQVYLE